MVSMDMKMKFQSRRDAKHPPKKIVHKGRPKPDIARLRELAGIIPYEGPLPVEKFFGEDEASNETVAQKSAGASY